MLMEPESLNKKLLRGNMNIKTTIYDLLGYFIPGFVSIVLVILLILQLYPIENISEQVKTLSSLINIYYAILLVVFSYILGFLFSGLSNIYFDRLFPFLKRKLTLDKILDNDSFKIVTDKFDKLFNTKLTDSNFLLLICYVESERPDNYSTALYYLSYYGMSRTLFFLFSLMSLVELSLLFFTNPVSTVLYLLLSLFLSLIFLFQFIRFVKYYKKQIAFSFTL